MLFFAITFAVSAYSTEPYTGTLHYVDQNATGLNDGTTWTDAFTDLQDALTTATGGDQIWVAAGIYKPANTSDRNVSFELVGNVAIYGGFNGSENSSDERDRIANETILSGDIGAVGDNSDNSYHVVQGAVGATLDGFTITAGNAVGATNENGGGFFNDAGINGVHVENCQFSENHAVQGGAVENNYCEGANTFYNCLFQGNSSTISGGAIANHNTPAHLVNCLFIGNTTSGSYGSAIYNWGGGSTSKIINCTFTKNEAPAISGTIHNRGVSSTITNSIIWGNTADNGDIINTNGGSSITSYSNIELPSGVYSGTGNINAEPLFIAAVDNNYRLQGASPSVDAGVNTPFQEGGIAAGTTIDFEGNPRIMQRSESGAIADMGAYEVQSYLEMVAEPSEGGNTAASPVLDYYKPDRKVVLTATPATGYFFQNWHIDGAAVSENPEFIYNMPSGDVTLTARFLPEGTPLHSLSLVSGNTDAGTVNGEGTFAQGEEITIEATVNEGYAFVNWTDEASTIVSTNNVFEYTMPDDDVTLTANFAPHFAGGIGTEGDPWIVESAEQLNNVRHYLGSEYGEKYFQQTANINLGVAPFNENEGWEPIGNTPLPFFGNYDGDIYIVEGLFLNRSTVDEQGLFGCTGETASISNIGLTNTNVTGQNSVGALVGLNAGLVSTSFTSGSVNGTDNVGGLIGTNNGTTGIVNCYSFANVAGNQYVGELAGTSSTIIQDCFSKGSVSGNQDVEGLVGSNTGSITNSFWDTETSNVSGGSNGTGAETWQMKDYSYYNEVGWDFQAESDNGTDDTWGIDESAVENEGYPFLTWQGHTHSIRPGITTGEVETIGLTSATISGDIPYIGTSDISAHGFCWNTSGNPSVADNITDEGVLTAAGAYTSGTGRAECQSGILCPGLCHEYIRNSLR